MANPALNRRAVLTMGENAVGAAIFASAGSGRTATASSLGPISDIGNRVPVAFVMGGGATMIDFAAPWEAFQELSAAGYTVGNRPGSRSALEPCQIALDGRSQLGDDDLRI